MLNRAVRLAFVAFFGFACCNCAQLQIRVYSYTGDETYNGDTQLAEAVGEAGQANMAAKQFLARIKDDAKSYGSAWTPFKDSLTDLILDYDKTDAIVSHAKALDGDDSGSPQRAADRHQLAVALVRYGQRCIAMGQHIGIPAENHLFWFLHETGQQPVITGIAIENAGDKIERLAANVLDQCEFTPLASVYKSLLPGMVQGQLDPLAPEYESLNNSSNWKLVNTQYFGGSGNLNDVVVKDEVGNWVQKSFSNDPTGVIDATFDGATFVVDTLAAAYGVPLPKTTGNTSDKSNSSTVSTDPDAELQSKAVQAKITAAQLKKIQEDLKGNLDQILEDNSLKDEGKKTQIVTTLQVYQTRLNALTSPSDTTTKILPAPAGGIITKPAPTATNPTTASSDLTATTRASTSK